MAIKTKINHSVTDIPDLESTIFQVVSSFESHGKIISQNRRNTIKEYWLADKGKSIVIKQYRNKGLVKKAMSLFRSSKARKAFDNGLLLTRHGIRTPQPVAYAEDWANGCLKASYYICRYTEDTNIIPLIERSQPEKKAIKAFAQLLAQLHDNGIVHHDLNLSNLLYHTEKDEMILSVIDINRTSCRADRKPETREKEYIDDLLRFTGRLDIFVSVAYEYARLRNIDAEPFVRRMTVKKIKHDANWTRRKLIHSFFNKK